MAQFRYRSPLLPKGATHRALEWVSTEAQRSVALIWFRERYEVRARKGGVLDALPNAEVLEILLLQFEDVMSSAIIEEVAVDLECVGEWLERGSSEEAEFALASERRRSQKQRRLSFGTPTERAARERLARELDRLEVAIEEARGALSGFGDNGAPRSPNDPIEAPSLATLASAAEGLRGAIQEPEPAIQEVERASQTVSRWARVWKWMAKKGDIAADSAAKVIGAGLVTMALLAVPNMNTLVDAAEATAKAAQQWIAAALEGEPRHAKREPLARSTESELGGVNRGPPDDAVLDQHHGTGRK